MRYPTTHSRDQQLGNLYRITDMVAYNRLLKQTIPDPSLKYPRAENVICL